VDIFVERVDRANSGRIWLFAIQPSIPFQICTKRSMSHPLKPSSRGSVKTRLAGMRERFLQRASAAGLNLHSGPVLAFRDREFSFNANF
jgi:hypothetical protein